jgi:hypothetical protein
MTHQLATGVSCSSTQSDPNSAKNGHMRRCDIRKIRTFLVQKQRPQRQFHLKDRTKMGREHVAGQSRFNR